MISQQLFNLLCNRIIPYFKLNQNHVLGQPWWWPIGTGYTCEEWFDDANNRMYQQRLCQVFGTNDPNLFAQLHQSLQGRYNGRNPQNVNRQPYQDFRGFWGYRKTTCGSRVVILSDQPSQNIYPSAQTTRWMKNLNSLGLQGVHVTDFVKIRGPIQAQAQVFTLQQLNEWRDLLIDELSILAEMETDNIIKLCIYTNNTRVRGWVIQTNLLQELQNRGIPVSIFDGGYYLASQFHSNEQIVLSWKEKLKLCLADEIKLEKKGLDKQVLPNEFEQRGECKSKESLQEESQKKVNEDDCCTDLGNAPKKNEEQINEYYERFFNWFTKRPCLQGYDWNVNGSWLSVSHIDLNGICINIAFSGWGSQFKVFKVEIYVTNNVRWDHFLNWLRMNNQCLKNLHNLPMNHQHTHPMATSENRRNIGTYAIRPSPLQFPEDLIYDGQDLPTNGYYGRISDIEEVQNKSVSFGHVGNDRRLVTWHMTHFDLQDQDDVNELAKWACQTFRIFHDVFDTYRLCCISKNTSNQ
jgi:hypothetical protein